MASLALRSSGIHLRRESGFFLILVHLAKAPLPIPQWHGVYTVHVQGFPSARGLCWVDMNFGCSTVPLSD